MNIDRPNPNRGGVRVGCWGVTTGCLGGWPCRRRVVEILEAGQGRLPIACTMVDHEGLIDPGEAEAPDEIAGLGTGPGGRGPGAPRRL